MSQTVYREIGGREAIENVVEDFYSAVLADDQLVDYFEGMDMHALRAHQVQFISSVTGGPVEYAGADMREAHAHLDIDEADFDAVGTHLERALRENGVAEDAVTGIMSKVEGLKAPIIGA
ncbi:group 1 truncated hemoglobin [Haladaptatus sp. DJG-WS-42]|uniref:group I truncated hemoglobin n=1 Tax=Haladaptatus sp. DJG-WS-42 TaxID=3120516 RepID=UPI0030D19143